MPDVDVAVGRKDPASQRPGHHRAAHVGDDRRLVQVERGRVDIQTSAAAGSGAVPRPIPAREDEVNESHLTGIRHPDHRTAALCVQHHRIDLRILAPASGIPPTRDPHRLDQRGHRAAGIGIAPSGDADRVARSGGVDGVLDGRIAPTAGRVTPRPRLVDTLNARTDACHRRSLRAHPDPDQHHPH